MRKEDKKRYIDYALYFTYSIFPTFILDIVTQTVASFYPVVAIL